MASASCSFSGPIPNPPTASSSCAVPIGGSNSTILDTCCNGHINPVRTYGVPGAKDECYMFCTTTDAQTVESCLEQNLGPFDANEPHFQCFNAVAATEGAGQRLSLTKDIAILLVLSIAVAAAGMV